MKPYPPTMREKRRYAVFEAISEKPRRKEEVGRALWSAVLETLGTLGAARSAFLFAEFDDQSQKGILRSTNIDLPFIRGSLALLAKIGESKALIRIIGVTGSIKKAKELMVKKE